VAVYVVQLDDKTSGPANTAAGAVSSLSSQFDALQGQLRAAESALNLTNIQLQQNANLARAAAEAASLQAQQQGSFAKHEAYKPASENDILAGIKKQQAAALSMHDANRDATEGLKKQGEAAAETSKWFSDLTASGNSSSEMLEQLSMKAEKLAGALAVGIEIISAYVVALFKLGFAAVSLTQEKNQLEATFDVFTDGLGGDLLDDLEALSKELPFTADKLNAWAKSLLAAGIKGDALKESIKAVAAATAIMGESGGAAAEGLIKRFAMAAEAGQKIALDRRILTQLSAAGVSVAALAKELGTTPEKLGKMQVGAKDLGDAMQRALIAQGAGPLAQLGNTWATMSAKISEGIDDAFEDLDDLVGPFMEELQSLASEFFAGSAASKDFASVIKAILTPAFEVATEMIRFLHLNFLRLQIAVLQVRVWLLPISSALSEIGISAGVVNVALYVLKGTLIVVAVALGLVALAAALIAAPFILAGIAVYLLITGVQKLVGILGGAVDNFDNIKGAAAEAGAGILSSIQSTVTGAASAIAGFPLAAAQAGLNFVLGLVQAIATGQGPVADAARALAQSALSAIKGALGIASPSKVMLQMGGYTAQGMAQGISKGTPGVRMAARGMGSAAAGGAAAGAGGGGGSKIEVHVHEGAIVIHGARDAESMTKEAVALVFEDVLLQIGARA
jgi:hypothetical protein